MSAKSLRMDEVPEEFDFCSDCFNLVQELTEDGERRQKEIDAAKQAKLEAERKQPKLLP